MAFSPTAAASFLQSELRKPVYPRQMTSNWTQAVGIIPGLNLKVQADLANSALTGRLQRAFRQDELDYYREQNDLSRRSNAFSALIGAGGKFAGDRLARAVQSGLPLPGLAGTANDLSGMLSVADAFGERARKLTARDTYASAGGSTRAVQLLKGS